MLTDSKYHILCWGVDILWTISTVRRFAGRIQGILRIVAQKRLERARELNIVPVNLLADVPILGAKFLVNKRRILPAHVVREVSTLLYVGSLTR